MTETHRVAVVPGDGVGPEVTEQARRVVDAVTGVEWSRYDIGADRYLSSGEVLPDSVLDELRGHDAILFGAVGDPRVPPGVLEIGVILALRQELDLYLNLRPAKLFDGVPSVLAGVAPGDIDILIVRENTEGSYSREGRVSKPGTPDETATELSVNTARAVERVTRYAYEAASARGESLTLVHKTNIMEHAGKLYDRVFTSVGDEFPTVERRYQHVDAAALLLATDPSRFEVIVTDNLFGDILSDLTAALAGGIGFVGSGNVHPGKTSVFEPVHGSAPDIAGSGRANPIGAVLSAGMMLHHLGEVEAAHRVEQSVSSLAGKVASGDFSTSEVGDLLCESLK